MGVSALYRVHQKKNIFAEKSKKDVKPRFSGDVWKEMEIIIVVVMIILYSFAGLIRPL